MIRQQFLFPILASVISLSCSIRVDWNTNTGPIVPPTPTRRPVPSLPYRNPAPVWESQNDDIPNPSPYQYVLPPPSRPRPATDNYLRAPLPLPQTYQYQSPQPTFGQFVSQHPNNLQNDGYRSVPTLAVQYVPNSGVKYHALAPSSGKVYYSKDFGNGYDKPNKLNGKYNPKLKKHKAYEKAKYVNYVYYVPAPQQQTTPSQQYEQQYQQQVSQPTKREISYRPTNHWGGFFRSRR